MNIIATEAIQVLDQLQKKLKSLETLIPESQITRQIQDLDQSINDPDIWNNPIQAANLMKDRQKLSDLVSKLSFFRENISYYTECALVLPSECEDNLTLLKHILFQMKDLEFKQMMTDPIDDSPAILSINAGAGGLEAANWVSILYRMYARYAAANKFSIEILDEKESEEHSSICRDSVSLRIDGPFAFGFLKKENGVHRLIRNSPFNANNARHTSFAAVSVTPDIEDKIDIKIEDKDIEVTSQTSSGAGGQNVNRIKSAIRLRHFPTGINILVRNERDQLANKKIAFKLLKAKLYEIEQAKKDAKKQEFLNSMASIAFGNQVRSYIMSPQALCKDHRSDYQTNDINGILDGNINELLIANLICK